MQVELDAMDAQLVDLRNRRDEVYAELWDKVKRVRNSVKGIYGDDSSEYEMVGGTRRSERKTPFMFVGLVALVVGCLYLLSKCGRLGKAREFFGVFQERRIKIYVSGFEHPGIGACFVASSCVRLSAAGVLLL